MMKKILIISMLTIGYMNTYAVTLHQNGATDNEQINGSVFNAAFVQNAIWFVIGSIFTLLMTLVFGKKKRRHHSSSRMEGTIHLPTNFNRQTQPFDFNSNNREKTISRVEEKVEKKETVISNDEMQSNTIELSVKNILPSQPKLASDETILYFPNPNQIGEFKNDYGSPTYTEGASIYKFTIKNQEARFEFCRQQSSVSIALNNRNELILSVADELNAYYAAATQIVCEPEQKGIVVLEGMYWKVKTKAKVKYI